MLVVACVFALLWVRGLAGVSEWYEIKGAIVVSSEGTLRFGVVDADNSILERPRWTPHVISLGNGEHKDSSVWLFNEKWGTGLVVMLERACVPDWSIVVPLTLLSAWLLLSKPRQQKLTNLIEPPTQTVP